MSKYDPPRDYLKIQRLTEFELTFTQIESILGVPLPKSAERPQWWANEIAGTHVQRESWRAAGYDAFLLRGAERE